MFKYKIESLKETAVSRGIIAFICGAGFGAGIALNNWISILFGIAIGIGSILDIRSTVKDIEKYARIDEHIQGDG